MTWGHLFRTRSAATSWAALNNGSPRTDKRDLIKVPGIGIKGAESILKARRTARLRELSSLKKLGIIAERAAPYVLLDGKRPANQLSMF